MASTRGRPSSGSKKARAMSTREFESSNSTTAAFLGGKQKDWMTGMSAITGPVMEISRMSANPTSLLAKSPKKRSQTPPGVQPTAEQYKALATKDFSANVFPQDFDRGRFPAQRRRRGGTKNYPGRSTTSVTPASTPPVPLSPMARVQSPGPISRETVTNSNDLPPSPTSSVGFRQQNPNIINLENEVLEPEISTAPLTARLEDWFAKYGFEGREILLQDKTGSNTFPLQHAASPSSEPAPLAHISTGPVISAEDSVHVEHETVPDAPCNVQSAPSTSKRASEGNMEPRKRMQSHAESPGAPEGRPSSAEGLREDLGQNVPDLTPSMDSEMPIFYSKVLQRLQAVTNLRNRPGSGVERPRLCLLRDACEHSDYFYLCLHQAFCLDHIYSKTDRFIPFLKEGHKSGLVTVTYLLVSNGDLTDDAVEWFSNFPLPMDVLLSRPAFRSAHEKVLICLAKLASNWEVLKVRCRQRGYPPLVAELVVMFNVESLTFQQVIFRALLRDLWNSPQDECFQRTEDVFPRNYREFVRARADNDSDESRKAHDQLFIDEFSRTALFHRQHLQQPSNSTMPPPQQGQPSLPPTDSPQIRHHRPLAKYPPDTHRPLSSHLDIRAAQQISHVISMTPAHTPSINRPQSVPAPRPGRPLRQGSSPHQNRAITGIPAPRGPVLTTPSTISQPFQSSRAFQNPLTGSLPPDQNVPRGFPTPRNLPSNTFGRGPIYPQQGMRPHPPPAQLQSPASRLNLHAHSLSGSQYEGQRRPFERGYHPSVATSNPTQFIHSNTSLNESQSNPTLNALHQAHVRSPILSPLEIQGKPNKVAKYFRFIKHVILPPEEISSVKRHVYWQFSINKALADTLVKDTPGSYGSPPTRSLVPGSRLCRVRCIKVDNPSGLPSQSEWAVSDNVWPGSTAVVLNGVALEIRKKSHHGKDLPVEATSYIKEGKNTVSMAIIGLSEDCVTKYAIGVEIIEVIEDQLIKKNITTLPWEEALKRIIDHSGNLDPDVLVVNSQMVVDLTDPFTAQIFEVPVRGSSCRHNQCFDRDIFLQTRNSKKPSEPCGPDEFRCPICGLDARPQSLLIDEFFVQVRDELQKRGRLDAKAITLHEQGEWEIREEEEVTGEQGDGSGRRNIPQSWSGARGVSTRRQSTPREVIEIDD